MTFICFFYGCAWKAGTPVHMGNEDLIWHCCSRCGSSRYLKLEAMRAPAGRSAEG
ncbi:PSPA7_2676 family Cys-rich small protein [Pseudomonas sp. BN417]|uniref:PSPA7_2676 family Cys-rich small protein n=1 Tax=Pseudomonas sp. BN417 TaxID=2567890 RepID=UPI002455B171|nr:PSPA7_2676 family Cys-rich small protein [Pseudomonas sp. BN417]